MISVLVPLAFLLIAAFWRPKYHWSGTTIAFLLLGITIAVSPWHIRGGLIGLCTGNAHRVETCAGGCMYTQAMAEALASFSLGILMCIVASVWAFLAARR